MPTARPIIEMMFVTNRLNSTIWPTSAVMPSAIPMATIAIPIGTSAATIAPNTTTSTTSATMIPIDSPLRASSSAIVVKSAFSVAWPASWVVNPSAWFAARTSLTPSTVGVSSFAIGDRDQRVVLVLGDESRRRLGRCLRARRSTSSAARRPGRSSAASAPWSCCDVRLERRVVDRERRRSARSRTRCSPLLRGRELLVDHVLRLDRLRLVRERDVVVEDPAEQRTDTPTITTNRTPQTPMTLQG